MEIMLRRLRILALILFGVLALGTIGFSLLEGMPYLDSLYLSVVTVATVGYGDLHPVTGPGKMLAVLLIITGVGTFLGLIANGTELLMERRQEQARRERLNMLISLFFSEIGGRLLTLIARADNETANCKSAFGIAADWSAKDFARSHKSIETLDFKVDPVALDIHALRELMDEKGGLLITLLSNPNLLEHEAFTELLRSIFHLRDELMNRITLSELLPTDLEHLAGDATRVYKPLTAQWLDHTQYLKGDYPYLYSLAVRMNPFAFGEEDCASIKG